MNKGENYPHIAYEVDNIEKRLNYFKKKNFLQISEVVPGAGHNFSKTIWLLGKKEELIELVEKQRNKKYKSRFTK